MGFSYDLHIHSCLSPCGDDDMTPPNIANMAALLGLDLIAVTDHNSCRNAGAVMEAARMLGLPLRVLPGMEVTTAEEVHVVCLVPELAAAHGVRQYAPAFGWDYLTEQLAGLDFQAGGEPDKTSP